MTACGPVVVIGAGHGGFTVAESLRRLGYDGSLTLIDAQDNLPYQRPPLSKACLTRATDAAPLPFRPAGYYPEHGIDYVRGDRCVAIDRARGRVLTAAGNEYPYAHLVLATGASAIPMRVRGAELDGVCSLRTAEDAGDLADRLDRGRNMVVVGGGFIGLEVAAAARARGLAVLVAEAMPRLMTRTASEPVSEHVLRAHEAAGVSLRLDTPVVAIHGDAGRVDAVELQGAGLVTADTVVLGIGVRPRVELAAAAGLSVDDGVVVDRYLRTSDPRIFAVGDCCAFPDPFSGRMIRLESVQNATDQARCVAGQLTGDPEPYRVTPWFWSDQGALKVQTVGLAFDGTERIVHGDPAGGRFSVLHLDGAGALVCGESVNSPADHVALRTLVADRHRIGPVLRHHDDVSLKMLARSVRDTRKRMETIDDQHRRPATLGVGH